MDRTAWIAVVLCTLGLIGWYVYVGKQAQQQQLQRQQLAATGSPTQTPLAGTSPSAVPLTASSPPPAAIGTPAPEAIPAFAEKIETLRNDDVELRLTNRGGGIQNATLLNHIAQAN